MLDRGSLERNQDKARERRKIVVRLAVAAGLIAVLLATLLLFEQQKEGAESPLPAAVSKPAIGVSLSSSSSPLPEDVQAAIKDAPDIAQSTLSSMSTPVAVETASAPVVPEGSMDPSVKPILGVPAPSSGRPAAHAGKETHNDRLLVEAPKGVAPAPAKLPAPPPSAAAAQPVNTNFVVQLGVFNNITNAEELRAKLKQAGIPSLLETRVQVGPFASRDEAVKAQDKLRKLGLGNGMLVAAAKKP
jgi:cell division septation protein DedD